MWQVIGKYALKLALWCYKNRADLNTGYLAVHNAIEDIIDAKAAKAAK